MTQKNLTFIVLVIVGLVLVGVAGYIAVSYKPVETRLPTSKTDQPQFIGNLQSTGDGRGLNQPMAVAVGSRDVIYVTDTGNNRVQAYRLNGRPLLSFGKAGRGKGDFNYPYGILSLANGHLLVADTGNYRVQEFSSTGEFIKIWLPSEQKIKPGMLTMDNKGSIYIADLAGHQIVVAGPDGKISRVIPGKNVNLRFPQGLAVDNSGQIRVADGGSSRVKLINRSGQLVQSWDGRGNEPEGKQLIMVRGLALDHLGRLFVCEGLGNKIRVFQENGTEIFSFSGEGTQGMLFPMGINVDQRGRIYIADRGNNRVQVWGYPIK